MSLMTPAFLWLLIPVGLLFYFRPRHLTDTIHLVIAALLIVSLSRPVIDKGLQEKEIEAQEIILALDLSYSMRANDITPDRYTFATRTIEALLQQNLSDYITLIAFTTNPLLLSPPTTDHQLIALALKSVQRDNILTHGTSLEKLFTKVADLPMEEKNLILITDGGDEISEEKLSDLITEHAITPIILAMGTTTGSTIPKPDGSRLKDSEGNLVVSRINPLLHTLASAHHGVYLTPASTPESTATALQEVLNSLQSQKQRSSKQTHSYIELYPLPLGIAVLLFLLVHTRGVKYLLLLFSLFGTEIQAGSLDQWRVERAYEAYEKQDYNQTLQLLKKIETPTLQSRIAEAHSHYRLGEYTQAVKLYQSIRSTSPYIKQQIYYNTGNAYAMLKSYEKARNQYLKALQLGEDNDTRYNLSLIAFLEEKKDALGIANPKSQDSSSSKSEDQEQKENENERSEDQPSSGSGSGGEMQKQKEKEEMKLIEDRQNQEQPVSSKLYEMINKGYIHEKQPW